MPATQPKPGVTEVTFPEPQLGSFGAEDEKLRGNESSAGAFVDMIEAARQCDEERRPDSDQVWNLVHETMSNYDQKMVSDWKDDLQNLLVFAGLFSGVVSSFALESYTWLQPDSGDTSAQLLAQISQQLVSFTINPGFLNSTNIPSTPPPFEPDPVSVTINTLWILSLALSLVAALFAIVVQQWLREYIAPATHLAVRERVRLRQLRRDALNAWGVPQTVSVLPILIQISLVLFLVGLLYLLDTINKVVFTPSMVFLGVAFSFYLTTLIMPFLSKTCPYKSPLSFTIICLISVWCAVAYLLVFTAVMLWILLLQLAAGGCWTRYKRAAEVHGIRVYNRLCRVGMNMGRAIPQRNGLLNSTGHEFWLARERNVLSEREHLDEDALTWVLPWLSHNSLPQLQSCIGELSLEERTRFVASWVAQALNLNTVSEHVRDAGTDGTRFEQHMLANVDSDFAKRFRDLLLDLLPPRWTTAATLKEQHYGPAFLLLLRQIAQVEPAQDRDYVVRYTKRVLAIRQIQGTISGDDLGDVGGGLVRLPTVAIFECCDMLEYQFDDSEFANLCQWNQEILAIRELLFNDFYPAWNHYFDLLFASSATYFVALAQRPGRLHDTHNLAECVVVIGMFNNFLPSEIARIKVLTTEAEHLCVDGVTYCISKSLLAIARSLAALINSGHLIVDPQIRSASATLLMHLEEIFDGQERFAEGVEMLGILNGYPSLSGELATTSMFKS